jgi:hypothetical protein
MNLLTSLLPSFVLEEAQSRRVRCLPISNCNWLTWTSIVPRDNGVDDHLRRTVTLLSAQRDVGMCVLYIRRLFLRFGGGAISNRNCGLWDKTIGFCHI